MHMVLEKKVTAFKRAVLKMKKSPLHEETMMAKTSIKAKQVQKQENSSAHADDAKKVSSPMCNDSAEQQELAKDDSSKELEEVRWDVLAGNHESGDDKFIPNVMADAGSPAEPAKAATDGSPREERQPGPSGKNQSVKEQQEKPQADEERRSIDSNVEQKNTGAKKCQE